MIRLNYNELYEKYKLLEAENDKLKIEINLFKTMLYDRQLEMSDSIKPIVIKEADSNCYITMKSDSKDKIELFKSLFRGRVDICAKKWKNKSGYSPYCFNDFKSGICSKPKIKCTECKSSNFAPLDEERINGHLLGKYVLGLYPLTTNDTCFLLVIDFDESTWNEDIKIILKICSEYCIPVYAERSRSGDGCHLWFFFKDEIKASLARKFGTVILNLAMQECRNINFSSYDRMFPSQDFLQKDGFGNLIALPLQKEARRHGNSVFIDQNLNEIEDQWLYLSQIQKNSEEDVLRVCKIYKYAYTSFKQKTAEMYRFNDEIVKFKDIGIKSKAETDNLTININTTDFPEIVVLEKCRGIKISKLDLSSKALFFLKKLASYNNPQFYEKQAMRQSTYGTPRVAVVYDEDNEYINLPRGVETELLDALNFTNIKYSINDNRYEGKLMRFKFCGQLTDRQDEAFRALNQYNEGILSAATGFGKTVIGARMIAEKKCATLILVHTKELANQWKERMEKFLQINEVVERRKKNKSIIGQLGGGKNSLHGVVDIAIMQSMFEKDKSVKQIINNYGLVIVDECHHISATNFSRIISAINAKYVYGLTATPTRKDGHHPGIFMHCGPIRYEQNAKKEALIRKFEHYIVPRFTSIRMPVFKNNDGWNITDIYKHICESKYRNSLIVADIIESVNSGRNPLVLTERTSQINELVKLLSDSEIKVIVLSGELKTRERKDSLRKIKELSNSDKFVIIATGKLIGEGFDEARLDTLFLAMPISWKGTITQYAGRLHRNYEGKNEVLIYDYVDIHIPVLERMYHKRLTAYKSIGYSIKNNNSNYIMGNCIYDETNYFEYLIKDIKDANKNVCISSSFLQKKKLNEIKDILIDKYRDGIRITLCIKTIEEYSNKYRHFISNFINEIEKHGINIIQLPNNHLKFMIIDNIIIWYGDIDILGVSYNDSSIIRVQNEELANELIGVVAE